MMLKRADTHVKLKGIKDWQRNKLLYENACRVAGVFFLSHGMSREIFAYDERSPAVRVWEFRHLDSIILRSGNRPR